MSEPLKLDRLKIIVNAVNTAPWPSNKAVAAWFGISASRLEQVLKRAAKLGLPVLDGEARRGLRAKGGEPHA